MGTTSTGVHNEEGAIKKVRVVASKYVEPVARHQPPERTQLQEIVCYFSKDLNPRDIAMRRISAIDTKVALSRRQEVQCHKSHLNKSSSGFSLEGSPVPKEESQVPNFFPLICEKTRCIFCIGDDRQSYDRRTQTFSKPDKMMNHVERHLKRKTAGSFECCHPICKAKGYFSTTLCIPRITCGECTAWTSRAKKYLLKNNWSL